MTGRLGLLGSARALARGAGAALAQRRQQLLPGASRAMASAAEEKVLLQGVVFDMDGTLVESCLDYELMYRTVGVPRGQDILAVVATFDEQRRAAALRAIHEIEAAAWPKMVLMAGAAELGEWCEARGLPCGLVTRNTTASVAHFHAAHWAPRRPFRPAVARDVGLGLRHKPHPDALLHCAAAWGVEPRACAMVGDSPRDDVVAGRRAGMATVLVAGDRGRLGVGAAATAAALQGEQVPHAVAVGMHDVPRALAALFTLPSPAAQR